MTPEFLPPSRRPFDAHRTVVEMSSSGIPFTLATMIEAEGSTPARLGAKAIIVANGAIFGTIGGGALEAEVQRRAVMAIQTGVPAVLEFRMQGAGVGDKQPICGGTVRVLIDPTAAKDRAIYAQAVEAQARRERGVLLTRFLAVQPSEIAVEWLAAGASFRSSFPGADALASVLAGETPRLLASDLSASTPRLEVLMDPCIPNPLLLIVGGGHVSQALARQASVVGFEIAVIEDRPDFARPALFPVGATLRCGAVAQELAAFPVSHDTYIALVTRGHSQDAEALAACIQRPAAYLGMIGSRRKVSLLRSEFCESGRATVEQFARVFAPIGLDLGAVTVPEIAVSIVAQLIAVRRKRTAARMPTS